VPVFPDPSKSWPAAAPAEVKARIRASVLAARRAMPPEVRTGADAAIRTALAALARGRSRITGYVPLPGEPGGADLPAVLADAVAPGELLLPVLGADLDLDWARYTGDLVRAARGLREPAGPRLGVDAVASADLVVVPAVAVDRQGTRLGRGGGSYDRALARVGRGVLVVAALYDGELVDRLPAQAHDRPVGAVVTPTGGFGRLRGPGRPRDSGQPRDSGRVRDPDG
jgi:5-formyltetrahydrofolate cyclo-ligase